VDGGFTCCVSEDLLRLNASAGAGQNSEKNDFFLSVGPPTVFDGYARNL
jgi:hypothetical protein